MGRSGKRARALKQLLARVGDVPVKPTSPRPGWSDLVDADLDGVVVDAYARLGGVHDVDVSAYRQWCATKGPACLTYGQYWTSDSSEHEFGPPGPQGDLSGRGSPRWKQRAYYDFIKDLAPACLGLGVARLSIYEEVRCGARIASLGEVLYSHFDEPEADAWAAAIANRVRHEPMRGAH